MYGGFDVIIGNPPFVLYRNVKRNYEVKDFDTLSTGNLFAFMTERSISLVAHHGCIGLVLPISAVSNPTFIPLFDAVAKHSAWISTYSNRPGKLFQGVEQRIAIMLAKRDSQGHLRTTDYMHWYAEERDTLFARLQYSDAPAHPVIGLLVKAGSPYARRVFKKLIVQSRTLDRLVANGGSNRSGVWYHDAPTYWVRALPFEPNRGKQTSRSSHYHRVAARDDVDTFILASLLNSTTFYFYFKMISNCRDLGSREWQSFPTGMFSEPIARNLATNGSRLSIKLENSKEVRSRRYPSGVIHYEEYYPYRAKSTIDEIDKVLAEHYGFTPEEMDWLINFDYKYRMGGTD